MGHPLQFDDSLVTPLVDADSFNAALDAAFALVGTGTSNPGHFILIHNLWLGLQGGDLEVGDGFGGLLNVTAPPYFLDGPSRPTNDDGTGPTIGGTRPLIEVLTQKASVGVDVRVMAWMPSGLTAAPANTVATPSSVTQINAGTLRSIRALRGVPGIGSKAIVNPLSHTAGMATTRLVVVGTPTQAIGFTGALDFESGRWARPFHLAGRLWHYMIAQIEGPAVQGLYDWFRSLWQETIGRQPRFTG